MMLKMLSNWVKNRKSCVKTGFRQSAILSILLVVTSVTTGVVQAKGFAQEQTVATISVSELPKQGQQVYALIAQGGPFEHDKDGVVFGNREQQLPKYKRGFYREYTVKTPGVRNRGAKRIVCGGLQVKSPEVCYYTEDHYSSFRKIIR
jgi:ribonuclease T1